MHHPRLPLPLLFLMCVMVAGAGGSEVLLLRRQHQHSHKHQEREQQRSMEENMQAQKQKDKFIFTTLAIGAAVIGAIQTGDNVYKMIDAEHQKRRYKKGLEKAVEYALDPAEFDADGNNQAIVAIMSAFQHCARLRAYTTGIWKLLWEKQRNENNRAAIEAHEDEINVESAEHGFDTAVQVSGAAKAATQILDNNDLDIDIFNDVEAGSSEQALLSLSIIAIKAFGKSMADYTDEKSRIAEKAKEKNVATFFSQTLSRVNLGVSIVSALFDPTGLSLLGVLSIAGSVTDEARMAEERAAWREHYCPALDKVLLRNADALEDAGMPRKTKLKSFHFGELVNNADCMERARKKFCLPSDRRHHGDDTPCLWHEDREQCTACPILPRGLGVTTEDQRKVCETRHRTPNGKRCKLVETKVAFGYNECCAVTKEGDVNKDLCH